MVRAKEIIVGHRKKLCDSVTNFIYQAKERLGLEHDEIPTF